MYTLKGAYGDVDDEPEMATVVTLGTYETRDEASEAARRELGEIKEWLDGFEASYDIKARLNTYYVEYRYIELEHGYECKEEYYKLSIVKR